MVISINKKKAEYLDNESARLVELVVEKADSKEKKEREELEGSLGEMEFLDLSDKLILPAIFYKGNVFGERTEQWERGDDDKLRGFDEDAYKEYKKFVTSLYKDKQVGALVSCEFLDKYAFQWIIDRFKKANESQTFTQHIEKTINDAIKKWEIRFLLLYIYIKQPFNIGNVEFNYFKKDFFDYVGKHSEEAQKEFQKRYGGRVYASCIVEAEKEKAIKIGREICSQAVDVLKICSIAMLLPQVDINFDLDVRAKVVQQSDVFILQPDIEGIEISQNSNVIPYQIGDHELALMNEHHLPAYHLFLLKTPKGNTSELEHLLINAIRRFGNAFSTKNTHQRVVELFTIMESLLLPNNSSPIIDSVVKYCPKIVSQDKEQRKEIVSFIRKMYDVRSALIHHAKEKDIEMNDIRYLQHIVNTLVCNLILRTDKHKTKLEILNEIDEAINAAY